jgi:hypothetical protein
VRRASDDRLDLWSERILEAQTLADLFKDD